MQADPIQLIKKLPLPSADAIWNCVDLTNLKLDATAEDIMHLCETALEHNTAAVCVEPRMASVAASMLAKTDIALACVCNFPEGDHSFEDIAKQIELALENNATEIDYVFAYGDYIQGKQAAAIAMLESIRSLCGSGIKLKVILESGAFPNLELLNYACVDVINAGTNFLKTSTGKISEGADLNSAYTMLQAIQQNNPRVGFKASGGIRSLEQAGEYYNLASLILGNDWVNKNHFRIGASKLSTA